MFFRVCDDYIVEIERIGNQATKASSMNAASRIQQSIHTLLALSTEARSMFPLILYLDYARSLPFAACVTVMECPPPILSPC